MEIAIRIGIAYVTNGVVSSPLEGFVKLEVRKRKDSGNYIALFFSGPIRSAGGTGASLSVLIGDFVRKHLGYGIYDPTEEEIKRMVTEIYDYHDKVTNLQYLPSEDEIRLMMSNLAVQIEGDRKIKRNIEYYNLIRAFFAVLLCDQYWVANVGQINKICAFYDSTIINVQAGDYSF